MTFFQLLFRRSRQPLVQGGDIDTDGYTQVRVARGEEIVITRHDKAVARIVPEGQPSRAKIQTAVANLQALRARIRIRTRGLKRLTDADVRSTIAEGRR